MTSIMLNNKNNAFPANQGFPLNGIREMSVTNFKTDHERFWMIVQFFDKDRNSIDFASIYQPKELALQVKEQYSSFVIILNTNDGEKEVEFDLALVSKN